MRPLAFAQLADENIHPDVVRALQRKGCDVRTVSAEGLGGRDDVDVLRFAHAGQRVVLTHDSDFGTLAVLGGEPFTGIIYLRPGHISPEFVIDVLRAVEEVALDVEPPFIVVAERRDDHVRIRIRGRQGQV